MGLSPLMIDKPGAIKADPESMDNHSRRFANKHFYISKVYALDKLKILNNHCDSFIVGSDQVWNYGISRNFGKSFYLDFVQEDKKKIAYASSFGHVIDFAPPHKVTEISYLMQQFDAISVREDDGVKICRYIYNVDATQVLDPVFLIDADQYSQLAEESKIQLPKNYILAYYLDATEEKKNLLIKLAEEMKFDIVILLDGFGDNAEKNRHIINMDDKIIQKPEIVDWLKCIKLANYVVTDSFHGASFSIIFNKQFMAIMNKARGFSRFQSLGRLFGVSWRMKAKSSDVLIDGCYKQTIDYSSVNEHLYTFRKSSIKWLKDNLFSPKILKRMTSYPIIDEESYNIKSITN